jgi:hypothetical protein
MGVNTTLMARTAAVPKVMCGCETFGVSDSSLHSARVKIALAASPAAAGKNPILTLLAADGTSGTLDPAFEAHAAVIRHWALAIWDKWFTLPLMQDTLDRARHKLAHTKGSWWSVTTGPTTALVATLRRIGWTCQDAATLITDEGRTLDLLVDPPIAVACEAKHAVRRRRWAEADKLLPGLLPVDIDVGDPHPSKHRTLLVPCTAAISTLIKGHACPKSAGDVQTLWKTKYRGDLASAACCGQWAQARKASVPTFGIDDARCQLCLSAVGTLEHGVHCS